MIRIAIVEDDEKARFCLQKYLLTYEKESSQIFKVDTYKDGIDIVNDYRPFYDVIMMDIQMQKMDGMTAAGEIRKVDKNVVIVFITNMVQYAVKGYSVDAMDYILKPLNYFTFAEHMKRILLHLNNKMKNFLVLNTNGGGILKIDITQISYMESQGHYIYIHKKDGVVSVLETMKNMEEALKNHGFFRCNNGYLVNLAYVERVEKYIVQVGKDEIQISRPKKKVFMEALTDYLGGIGK